MLNILTHAVLKHRAKVTVKTNPGLIRNPLFTVDAPMPLTAFIFQFLLPVT
jgi:hypothetical protein